MYTVLAVVHAKRKQFLTIFGRITLMYREINPRAVFLLTQIILLVAVEHERYGIAAAECRRLRQDACKWIQHHCRSQCRG